MAKVRRTMRLVVDGETIEVQTNAMDLVKAEKDGQGPISQGLRTAHQACLRQRRAVPVRFDDFLSLIDTFDDITDDDEEEDGRGEMDPTRTADSGTSQ